jgi:hypothetical protein
LINVSATPLVWTALSYWSWSWSVTAMFVIGLVSRFVGGASVI